MEQLTIKQLAALCKHEIAKGNGNKFIVISNDIEGNGYHGLFYGFTPLVKYDDEYGADIYDSLHDSPEDTIILG